jgi:hypothetical protein
MHKYDSPSKKDGAIPNVIFNQDRIQPGGVMVLTEGPFDALRLPEYAVALIGSGWNAAKRGRVLARRPGVVLLALDQDGAGRKATEIIYHDLLGLVPVVDRLKLPAKDLGGLSRSEVAHIRSICRAVGKATGVPSS